MQDDMWKRGYIPQVSDPRFAESLDKFIVAQVGKTYPGAKPLKNDYQASRSTALTVAFDTPPGLGNYLPSVIGLEGCTSVVIIGEKGCWISHLWEAPWFLGYRQNARDGIEKFLTNIINPIENGGKTNMPSPFAPGGQTSPIPELEDGESVDGAPGYKPEIRILTPDRSGNGNIDYQPEVRYLS